MILTLKRDLASRLIYIWSIRFAGTWRLFPDTFPRWPCQTPSLCPRIRRAWSQWKQPPDLRSSSSRSHRPFSSRVLWQYAVLDNWTCPFMKKHIFHTHLRLIIFKSWLKIPEWQVWRSLRTLNLWCGLWASSETWEHSDSAGRSWSICVLALALPPPASDLLPRLTLESCREHFKYVWYLLKDNKAKVYFVNFSCIYDILRGFIQQ